MKKDMQLSTNELDEIWTCLQNNKFIPYDEIIY